MVVKHDLAEDRGVELIPLLEGEVAIASVRELGVVKSDDVAGGGQIDLGGFRFRHLHGSNVSERPLVSRYFFNFNSFLFSDVSRRRAKFHF